MSEILERTSETVSFNPLLLLLNFFPTFYDKSSKNRIKLKEFYGQHLCVTHLDAVTLSHQAFIALAHLLTMVVLIFHASHSQLQPSGGGGGLVTKSCLTLCDPWTIARQATLSMGFSRQEYWSG